MKRTKNAENLFNVIYLANKSNIKFNLKILSDGRVKFKFTDKWPIKEIIVGKNEYEQFKKIRDNDTNTTATHRDVKKCN